MYLLKDIEFMLTKRFRFILFPIIASLALMGCGQNGSLYLPKQTPQSMHSHHYVEVGQNNGTN